MPSRCEKLYQRMLDADHRARRAIARMNEVTERGGSRDAIKRAEAAAQRALDRFNEAEVKYWKCLAEEKKGFTGWRR